jgi:glycosyltransferase involved in cell wall biosynthesis
VSASSPGRAAEPPRRPARPLIVVPALNEAEAIAGVLAEVGQVCPSLPVLVVDDGSHDETAALARAAGVSVVSLPFTVGVGGAMRAGFLYAARNGHDGVVQVDGDGQHDPRHVHSLLAALSGADVVVGSRFAGEADYRVRGPRRWAMRLLARALSLLCRARLTDVTSGFRASGPRAVGVFARNYPREYLGDSVESLVVARKAGLSVAEVGVAMRARVGSRPSQSPVQGALYLARAALVLLLAVVRVRPAPPVMLEPPR